MSTMWTIKKLTTASLLAALSLMLVIAWGCYRSTQGLIINNRWVEHTHEVMDTLDDFQQDMVIAESGQRGFILMGDEQYLAAYREIQPHFAARLEVLKNLTQDNLHQQRRIETLRPIVHERIALLNETIATRRERGIEDAQVIQTDRERHLVDDINRILETMKQEEQELLKLRMGRAEASARYAVLMLFVGIMVSVGLLLCVFYFLNRQMSVRAQSEASLRRSEERFQLVTRATKDAIWDWNLLTNQIWWNDNFPRMFGYGIDELERSLKAWMSRIHPDDVERVKHAARQVMETGEQTWTEEYRFRRSDGSCAVVSDRAYIVHDGSGKPVRMIGSMSDISESKRAEDMLAESEKRYRDLVENSQGLICVHDLEGILLSVNLAAAQALDFTPDEMIGRNLIEFIAPTAQPFFGHYLQRIATGPSVNGLMNICNKEGEERIWQYRNVRVEEYGKKIYVLGHAQDITEAKRAEESLRESEERFRQAFGEAPIGIALVSLKGRWLQVNRVLCQMFGYSEAELLSTDSPTPTYPDDLDPDLDYMRRMVAGEISTHRMEKRYFHKQGRLVFTRLSVSLVHDREGCPLYFISQIEDITERKRIEEAHRESEERFRLVVEGVRDYAILMLDTGGHIVSWNYGAEKIKGYNAQEIIGQHFRRFYSLEDQQRKHPEHELEIAAAEGRYEEEGWRIRRDGTSFWATVVITSLYDESGKLRGFSKVVRDITERKRMEEELKQAHDAALESVRLKSEFLANMSHEIRTPMNGVIGMTGLLLDTELSAEQRDFAETIRSSGDALLTIINDILDFSKIEAGKLQFETLDFNLTNVIEGTVELLAECAQHKKIELASLIYSDVPTELRGDPGRLRQVLANLIGNALKFTEQGEVIVLAANQSETDKDVVIRFTVHDTGIGISKAAQCTLFNAFTQADGSTTRRYGGTGLGLAISKQLVELIGGEIGVTSEPGKGSTFWFTTRYEKQPLKIATTQPDVASLDKLRVLIVDDNATNRKILSHQLDSWKMIHQEANSGRRALELLREASAQGAAYDLAILDLMMPEMDGFELVRAIKSDARIAGTPLVLLTSFGQRGHGAMAREAGVAAYLTKPVRQSQLFDCLTTVISYASSTHGSEIPPTRTTPELLTRHNLKETQMMSNKLILLAEDNIVNQKVAVRQLQKLGYRADTVANGREVLEALGKIHYNLVLMDCQMPEMDGYEATAEIRRREGEATHIPIVAMTANALEGDRERCIAAGMDDYVSKPVRPEELGEVLGRLLSSAIESVEVGKTMTQEVLPPVDMKRLYMAMGDDPEDVADIMGVYLSRMPEILEILDDALKSGNAGKVNMIAHVCAGVSANCGMTAVVEPLRALERKGRENQLAGVAILSVQTRREFERIKLFLQGESATSNVLINKESEELCLQLEGSLYGVS